jgi:hypothetical protein
VVEPGLVRLEHGDQAVVIRVPHLVQPVVVGTDGGQHLPQVGRAAASRGGSRWLSVMAWKQESQNHWKG